jgi:uncharacterized damage-inducible protein DinB
MEALWKTALWNQFGAAIDMLDNALDACPPDAWRARVVDVPFWYVAYHTLFWLDLYLSGTAEGFAPPAHFTFDELDPAAVLPDQPYTKDDIRAYLQHCRAKCQSTIIALTDARAQQRCVFGSRESSFLELLLYTMRHVQEHAAQLSLVLGQQIGWNPGWVAKARD